MSSRLPFLNEQQRDWLAALAAQFRNPECPSVNCKHPMTQHTFGRYNTCEHITESTNIEYSTNLTRIISDGCKCNLNPREVLLNARLKAQSLVAEDDRRWTALYGKHEYRDPKEGIERI